MTETTVNTVLVTAERTGARLPAAGTFIIDPGHSYVGFVARHLMVANVRGQFTDFAGSVTIAEDPAQSSAHAIIQTASITTHNEQRDTHLRSADFFDTDRNPTMRFQSTGMTGSAQAGFRVLGELSIKECTRPVPVDFEVGGVATDPWGQQRIALTATTEIVRDDFGITFNAPLEGGGFFIGRTVKIEIDIEAIRQPS